MHSANFGLNQKKLDADLSDRMDKNKKLNQTNPLDPRPIILVDSSANLAGLYYVTGVALLARERELNYV